MQTVHHQSPPEPCQDLYEVKVYLLLFLFVGIRKVGAYYRLSNDLLVVEEQDIHKVGVCYMYYNYLL
jgi:hypothetical protein